MENLNAETVKRGLECCANNDECVGEACPYYATGCEKSMPKDALALIKELTEDNAELRREYDSMAKSVNEASELIRKLRAGTVQKMQDKVRKKIKKTDWLNGRAVYLEIDQIAKEILEGGNE